MNKSALLCRIGLHKWKGSNGTGYTRGDSPMVIFYDRDCQRCGKHEERAMVQ